MSKIEAKKIFKHIIHLKYFSDLVEKINKGNSNVHTVPIYSENVK